jgi:hypothetical protein
VSKLDDIMAKIPTATTLSFGRQTEDRTVAVFKFAETGFGFGEITFVADAEGRLFLDGECMSRDKIKEILGRAVDDAILDTETDPDLHALYNEVKGRTCGHSCVVCYGAEGTTQ